MGWFERITGFEEESYTETKARLSVVDGKLECRGGKSDRIVGTLTLPSVSELRLEADAVLRPGRLRLSIAEGDVREMHGYLENAGALFQVASQFNMLEMVGPGVSPESGVDGYQYDRTQGPACAIAVGAATIYRNYLVPVDGEIGQTKDRQLDGLADVGVFLAHRMGTTVDLLWQMRNGYALPTKESLGAIVGFIESATFGDLDILRGLLRLGILTDAEVTDVRSPGPLVSQIFCSALPVSYSGISADAWAPFARLVLEAAYEGTMLAGLLNAARGASKRILLTRLGGGAFGNDDDWIDAAMLRSLRLFAENDLDVSVVSYGSPSRRLVAFVGNSGLSA